MPILTTDNIMKALRKANPEISKNISIYSINSLHSPDGKYELLFIYKDGVDKKECDELIKKVLMRGVSNPPKIVHGFTYNHLVFENPLTSQIINNLMEDCDIKKQTSAQEPVSITSVKITGMQGGSVVSSITIGDISFFSNFSNQSKYPVDITIATSESHVDKNSQTTHAP